MRDTLCPVCNAELPLTGEEEWDDIVLCPYCSCPLKIKEILDDGALVLIEDF